MNSDWTGHRHNTKNQKTST